MADLELHDSDGNTYILKDSSDYGDYTPSKPKRVYPRKNKYKLFFYLSIFMFIGHIVAYFVGVFNPKDWKFTLGMLGFFLPSIIILVIVFLVSRRFIKPY